MATHIPKKVTFKSVALLVLGLTVLGFSIYGNLKKTEDKRSLDNNILDIKNQNNDLTAKLEEAAKNRIIDSANRVVFEKYLKDSFGIRRIGNVPFRDVYNTTNYYTSTPGSPAMPDSINFGYSYSNNKDTLSVYPRIGSWGKPFVAFDTSFSNKKENNLYQPDGTSNNIPDMINFNEMKYVVETVFTLMVRSKQRPLVLDLKGTKNQPIFFGDASDPQKRYLYKNGKFYWAPNIDLTKDNN